MKWIIYFLCLILSTIAAHAETTSYFTKHDLNKDGKIDKKEYYEVVKGQIAKENITFTAQIAEQRFFNRDINQDSFLDDAEFSFKPDHNPKWGYFKKTDKNNNGFVSKSEFMELTKKQLLKEGKTEYVEDAQKRFDKRDANKDGKLSVQEFFLFHPKKTTVPEPTLTRL